MPLLAASLLPVPPLQEEFEGVVVEQAGFKYKPERPQEETFVGQKWGWTAEKPGEAPPGPCHMRSL